MEHYYRLRKKPHAFAASPRPQGNKHEMLNTIVLETENIALSTYAFILGSVAACVFIGWQELRLRHTTVWTNWDNSLVLLDVPVKVVNFIIKPGKCIRGKRIT
jgi:hypothetical protein